MPGQPYYLRKGYSFLFEFLKLESRDYSAPDGWVCYGYVNMGYNSRTAPRGEAGLMIIYKKEIASTDKGCLLHLAMLGAGASLASNVGLAMAITYEDHI